MKGQVTKAALYCRISRDSEKLGLGIARQERECRAWADANGWTIAEVYQDNDLSAFSGKRRPGYERMLSAVQVGESDGVLSWANDRLHRHPRELEGFIDVVNVAGVPVQTLHGGAYDLTTVGGRLSARIVGSVARAESEQKSERAKAKHAELMLAGKPAGGRRCFGYSLKRDEIIEAEAAYIRSAAEQVLDGRTLRSICREWNDAGVTTTQGRSWYQLGVRRVLISDWVAGMRGDVKATWQPILDEVTHKRLVLLLTDPSRLPSGSGNVRKLLSGLAICGLCRHSLVSRPRGDGAACYVCSSDCGGCGKIRSLAEPLETDLIARLWSAIDLGRLQEAVSAPEDHSAAERAVQDLEDHAALLLDMLGARELSRDDYNRAKARNDAQLVQARASLVRDLDAEREDSLRSSLIDVRERWDGLDVEEQRLYLTVAFTSIVVMPAIRGLNRYQPERLQVEFAF